MRLISLLFVGQLALAVVRAEIQEEDLNQDLTLLGRKPASVTPLVVGPNDTNIARLVVSILEHSHYLRKPLGDEVSSQFLDRYLDALDNLHMYFLQSDLQEFERFRYELDDLTKRGDTTPSRIIFTRFRERLDQQYDYVMDRLEHEQFEFKGNDRYIVNRKEEPRPKDLDEARKLWRERLRYEYLQEKLNQEKPAEILKTITRRYNRVLRFLNEYDNDDVLQVYLTALAHVYDPHSDYMGKSTFDNFSINMRLSLFGIGALLRSEDGICRIQSLTPEGPAEKSKKLQADDKIIAVAQSNQPPVDVVDMPLRKVVQLIRGPKGTEVRLTIIPADAADSSVRKVVALIRDEIKLEDQAAKAKIYELPTGRDQTLRLGVIDLPSFYSSFEVDGRNPETRQKSTTEDVARLLTKLKQENVAGIVLDLRRNGGGSLEEAIKLTGLFINEGPVVQVKSTGRDPRAEEDPNDPYAGEFYTGPVVVLVSRFSASASEILAGALQDYDRALVVGDSSTHGKGTVQSLIQLAPYFRAGGISPTNNPGAVKITIRKFYRASGGSTQLEGVVPDIVLPSVYNDAKIGEDALDNPLPWDKIPAASFQRLGRISPHLQELKRRSEARVSTDKDFAYLREEIVRAKKAREAKSVSLNEEQRLLEKQEADARAKARKKELASRPELPGKVFEITLKNVDLPGLPPPLTHTNSLKGADASGPARDQFLKNRDEDKVSTTAGTATAQLNTNKVTTRDRDPGDNQTVAANPAEGGEDSADRSEEESTPALDITLEETKRILQDLVALSANTPVLAGASPEKKD